MADLLSGDAGGPNDAQLVIRSRVPPATLAGSVLRALRELNPNQPAAEFRPIADDCGSGRFAAAVFHAAGGDFCGAGTAAGGAGDLRRDCVR